MPHARKPLTSPEFVPAMTDGVGLALARSYPPVITDAFADLLAAIDVADAPQIALPAD
jgi:hypothetical protein